MELMLLILAVVIIFLPLLVAGSLIKNDTPSSGVIGQTMLLAMVLGGLFQAISGGHPHIGVSLLLFPVYVGANFVVLMIILGLRAMGEPTGEAVAPRTERNEYEKLLFRFDEQ
ncbi:MAG: hypothetical protein ACPGYT_14125 [Nitrospirales bacterium]